MNIKSSYQIKAALMWYYRYRRNMICAPELHCADIMVYDGSFTHEIEIKISKSDLWNGEARKDKHASYAKGRFMWGTVGMPNKFSVCVPMALLETTKEWVLKNNKKYGILVCANSQFIGDAITIVRTAKNLHDDHDRRFNYSLLRKLSSMAVQDYEERYWKDV